ncbi:hypothetical protein AMAG_13479 [Allomyces macrogynus ATCC 38327]|uniref:UBZ4-type domain-containing protein n=1 Tax=Allomyces macrogynus (strain ATCC 38327) TaxID=578462 RepID=A0A0L0T2F7_ALLM3|nr:hypothetical protein AMAG_13479 [Allomyces macrogynus ATCC 38327]|eukprot:KNE68840.1 hypothetical protein AMAG_13479 [Allomyces macrogynus ATCC 38327]
MMDPQELVECPACARRILMHRVNEHLDRECGSFAKDAPQSPAPAPATSSSATPPRAPPSPAAILGPRQASLHAFFGGQDPTIPEYFILTRDAIGALTAGFSRALTVSKITWHAAVHLRGLRKSIVVVTDLALDEDVDAALLESGDLAGMMLVGEEDVDEDFDDEDGDDDESTQEGIADGMEEDDTSSSRPSTTVSAAAAAVPADAMDVDGTVTAPTAISTPPAPLPRADSPYSATSPLTPSDGTDSEWTNVPYLKSHLQKCTRRRLVDLAVATASVLLKLDWNELIRRLPIIMVEDTHLTSSFTVLTWLMLAASKGFILPVALRPDVLGMVAEMAGSTVQDHMQDEVGDVTDADVRMVLGALELAELPRWGKDLLWSVRCRREFGGMKGDMAMLDRCLVVMYRRLMRSTSTRAQLEATFHTLPHVPRWTRAIPLLTAANFQPCAIDFHVAPVASALAKEFGLTEDQVREVMWTCSSGVNLRNQAKGWGQGQWVPDDPPQYAVPADLARTWAMIESSFMREAREWVRRRGFTAATAGEKESS